MERLFFFKQLGDEFYIRNNIIEPGVFPSPLAYITFQ